MGWIDLIGGLGVLLLVAVSYLLGGWRDTRLKDIRQASERMRRDYLNFAIDEGVLDTNGASALLAEAGTKRMGIVFSIGDAFATRLLKQGDITSVHMETEEARAPTLTIGLDDFSKPELVITTPTLAVAHQWRDRLNDLCAGAGA